MREKTLKKLFDNVFWYALYMLPIFYGVFVVFRTGEVPNINSIFSAISGLQLFGQNPIMLGLYNLFGNTVVLPLFANDSGIFLITGWFASVYLVHLAVDVLLFIPRLAHKWMDSLNTKLGGKE